MKLRYKIFWLILALCVFCLLPANAHAAQLLIQLAGGALGFLIGGPVGAGVGFLAGGLLGSLLFPQKLPTVYGPRLEDKTVQSGAFGAHITWHWGTDRLPAQLIFSSEIKETQHKTQVGGKGLGSSQSAVSFTYSVDVMLAFSRRGIGVKRIWADTKLIFDVTNPDIKQSLRKEGKKFTVRDGNESQLPSALEESYFGAGNVSAHRSLFCLEAADFQLADFANRIPNFTAEVYTEGENTFDKIGSYTFPDPPYSWWVASWGFVDSFGEIWALASPASTTFPYPGYAWVFHWTAATPDDPLQEFHQLLQGTVTQTASVHGYVRLRSDEPSAAAWGTNNEGVALSYFRLATGETLNFPGPMIGMEAPDVAAKDGDDLYVLSGNFLYFGANPHHLSKLSMTGLNQLTDTDILQTLGGGADLYDIGVSTSYVWALFSNAIIRLDRGDLSYVDSVDLSSMSSFGPRAMAIISDSEAKLMTIAGDGLRFFTVTASSPPMLDHLIADMTYNGIRDFPFWGLRYADGIYVVDFAGMRVGGFPALIDFFGPISPTDDIPLWKIQRDICLLAGMDSIVESIPPTVGDIDVTDLTDLVHGYSLTRAMSARDASVQLAQTYFFDARDSDAKLKFIKRGKATVATIPGDDLAARNAITDNLPDRLTQSRTRETELPIRIHVIYNNWEFAYQPAHEYAPRLITDARKTTTLQIAVAIDSQKARQIASTQLAIEWLQRETFTIKTARAHLQLDAADNIEVVITET